MELIIWDKLDRSQYNPIIDSKKDSNIEFSIGSFPQ
nr:MAG TPA: hypothetical protein [Caudoviricetes sp.]